MPITFLKEKRYLEPSAIGGKVIWSFRGEPTGNISIDVDPANTRVRCCYTRTFRDDTKKDYDYSIQLVTTKCFFGGYRYWYICPILRRDIPCNARVGVMYMVDGILGCRKCHNLAYASQQETHSGKWNALRAYLTLENRCSSQRAKLRVKYWKGQATKRYKKVLQNYDRLDAISPSIANMDF